MTETDALFSDAGTAHSQALDEMLAGLDEEEPADSMTSTDTDSDAPYGRFANGKPRRTPPGGRKPKPRRRTPSAPRKTSARKQAGPDYEAQSMSLIAIGQATVGLLGTMLRNDAFRADTATLIVMGPQLAKVSGDLARNEARWGQVLDRMATTSTWTPPLMAAFSVGVQIAVNHGLIPAGVMGTRSPDDVLDEAARIISEAEAGMASAMGAA